MKFEPRKFYKHEHGRAIAVLGTVLTHKWGPLFVIEETDSTGYSISCVEADSEDLHERWVEIGKQEFIRTFNNVQHV